jgi:hypothetical protein
VAGFKATLSCSANTRIGIGGRVEYWLLAIP